MLNMIRMDMLTLRAGSGTGRRECGGRRKDALHYAAGSGRVKLRLLIRNGVHVNAVDRTQWTALHFAAIHGHGGVAVLIRKKCVCEWE